MEFKLVAESEEKVRVPVSAREDGQWLDPSNSGTRTFAVALVPQGDRPTSFPITATSWEVDINTNPDTYYAVFITPGNLLPGRNYRGFLKFAAAAGEEPVKEIPAVFRTV
jgi:hypothetical protein